MDEFEQILAFCRNKYINNDNLIGKSAHRTPVKNDVQKMHSEPCQNLTLGSEYTCELFQTNK